jgi:VanZ family protein
VSASRFQLWLPLAAYMAVIFAISSIPNPPDLPSAVGDKGGHALLYFGLGALFVRALAGGWSRGCTTGVAVAAVFYSTLYGITDEIHQAFVPPRQAEVFDVVADGLGAAAAAVLLWGWARRRVVRRRSMDGSAAKADIIQTRDVL